MTVHSDIPAVRAKIRAAVSRAMLDCVEAIHEEATSLILDGEKTGRVYRRRGVEHQASAPGESPSSDTDRLVQSGHTEVRNEPSAVIGSVSWSTAYADSLEHGTESMEPRPFARPALATKRQEILKVLATAIIMDVAAKRW